MQSDTRSTGDIDAQGRLTWALAAILAAERLREVVRNPLPSVASLGTPTGSSAMNPPVMIRLDGPSAPPTSGGGRRTVAVPTATVLGHHHDHHHPQGHHDSADPLTVDDLSTIPRSSSSSCSLRHPDEGEEEATVAAPVDVASHHDNPLLPPTAARSEDATVATKAAAATGVKITSPAADDSSTNASLTYAVVAAVGVLAVLLSRMISARVGHGTVARPRPLRLGLAFVVARAVVAGAVSACAAHWWCDPRSTQLSPKRRDASTDPHTTAAVAGSHQACADDGGGRERASASHGEHAEHDGGAVAAIPWLLSEPAAATSTVRRWDEYPTNRGVDFSPQNAHGWLPRRSFVDPRILAGSATLVLIDPCDLRSPTIPVERTGGDDGSSAQRDAVAVFDSVLLPQLRAWPGSSLHCTNALVSLDSVVLSGASELDAPESINKDDTVAGNKDGNLSLDSVGDAGASCHQPVVVCDERLLLARGASGDSDGAAAAIIDTDLARVIVSRCPRLVVVATARGVVLTPSAQEHLQRNGVVTVDGLHDDALRSVIVGDSARSWATPAAQQWVEAVPRGFLFALPPSPEVSIEAGNDGRVPLSGITMVVSFQV